MQTHWLIAADPVDWLRRATDCVARCEAEALARGGVFHIVLAGGGTPRRLYEALAGEDHDWAHWQVWFGDERCLPRDDPERNSAMASGVLLDRVAPGAIHPIPAELGPETAAHIYSQALAGIGQFDLVLLGLGEDGHTASLFPGQDWGMEAQSPAAMPIHAAPKPPAERVSLAAWRLSQARCVLFLVTGAGKQAAVAAWRRGEPLPATAIRPAAGVDVLLDRDAMGEDL